MFNFDSSDLNVKLYLYCFSLLHLSIMR